MRINQRLGPPLANATETILVAEDEPMVRAVIIRILERAGYITYGAGDGEEAVNLFREYAESTSLVLLDVVMPKLGGRESLRRMRQMKPNVCAVFLTGYDPASPQIETISDEGAPLLQKPFSPEALLGTLRGVLDELARRVPLESALVGSCGSDE